jgi:hypothetical protein
MSFPVYPAPNYQYQQPIQYRQPVVQQRAPVAAAPKPQPLPAKPQAALAKAVVPPPDALGIHLDDVPIVDVPEPAKLGIRLE